MAKRDSDFDAEAFIEEVRRSSVPGYFRANEVQSQKEPKTDTTTTVKNTTQVNKVVREANSTTSGRANTMDAITESTITTSMAKIDEDNETNEATKTVKANIVQIQDFKSLTSYNTREEFMQEFFSKIPTKGGSPITIGVDVLKRAYKLCARSGYHKTCPTYLINNILKLALDSIENSMDKWGEF